MTRSSTACGRALLRCPQGGEWSMAKRTVLRAWSSLSRIGRISDRRACASGWRRAGLFSAKSSVEVDIYMEPEGGALPLSRGQLDIGLSHESGLAGTEWQLGLLGRIDGAVRRDLLEQAIRQSLQEAE